MIKEYDKALKDFFESQAIDDNYENNSAIAECFLFKNEFLKAVDYFDSAISLLEDIEANDKEKILGINYRATKARTLNNQAYNYFCLQRFALAIDCSTKGIEANPNYSGNFCIRGLSYLSIGNQNHGRSDLLMAAQLGNQRAVEFLSQI